MIWIFDPVCFDILAITFIDTSTDPFERHFSIMTSANLYNPLVCGFPFSLILVWPNINATCKITHQHTNGELSQVCLCG